MALAASSSASTRAWPLARFGVTALDFCEDILNYPPLCEDTLAFSWTHQPYFYWSRMNIALWVLQILFAELFMLHAVLHLFPPPRLKEVLAEQNIPVKRMIANWAEIVG